MPLDSETRGIIDNLLSNNKVVLFMKGTPQQPQCGFSAKTTAALDMLIPDFMSVNVLDHPTIREGIKEYANWPTIPQLYIDGELIGGSDIVLDMMKSGDLAEALGVDKPATNQPKIKISDDGIAAMKKALDSQPDGALHLQISATWSHQIALEESRDGDICVNISGIEFHMDPWTAARADGLNMILEEDLTGTRFVFDNPNAPPSVNQMTVHELKARLDGDDEIILIDVRPEDERHSGSIEGSRSWNDELRIYVEALPKDTEIIVHCQIGGRSQALADALRQRDFTNLHNVIGGIEAWIEAIDPDKQAS
jgi:monothiol glutaredoxin